MSRRGNCYDNAVMESFFSTVKSELADQFASHGEAQDGVVRLHRGVLQPAAPAFDARPDQPGGVRTPGGGVKKGMDAAVVWTRRPRPQDLGNRADAVSHSVHTQS